MPAASELQDRIVFSQRAVTSDGYGNAEADFADAFTRWANIRDLRGGEGVIAERLQGRQPVIITVRQDSDTEDVTTDWRARDARTGRIYNIRTIHDPDGKRMWFEMLAEGGVAT